MKKWMKRKNYTAQSKKHLRDKNLQEAAKVLSLMEVDDAVDVLDEVDDATKKQVVDMLPEDAGNDIQMILSYEEDEMGSRMTTNYIAIRRGIDIRQAMRELVSQAGENDNIGTVYVLDESDRYYGAIDLKDLIVARENDTLESIINTTYPFVIDHEKIEDCIDELVDYAEDSIPVLSETKELLGVITAQDVVEAVDDEMGEDYAKLAGLTDEEDLRETTKESMKKRLPWLIILLFLGMGVSSVVGAFEAVVAVLPIVMCFQSLILDMAGNVGTQSLAVTIRVLMLGSLAFVFIGIYIACFKHNAWLHAFLISGCVGVSLMVAMVISSLVGTLIPIFFHKIKIDPAVASGPLITTVNDLVAVVTYYGLAWLFLIQIMQIVS